MTVGRARLPPAKAGIPNLVRATRPDPLGARLREGAAGASRSKRYLQLSQADKASSLLQATNAAGYGRLYADITLGERPSPVRRGSDSRANRLRGGACMRR